MKKIIKQSMLTLGIISMLMASVLYAELEYPPNTPGDISETSNLEEPPVVPDLNVTEEEIETPPEFPDLNETTGDNNYQKCDYNSYLSVISNSCVPRNAPTQLELTTGVWLDAIVNRETPPTPPTPTGEYSGCYAFSGITELSLDITEKDENNDTVSFSANEVYYDPSNGMLSMQFAPAGESTNTEYESLYLTKEGNLTFSLRYDDFDGTFIVNGLIVNSSDTCENIAPSLVYKDDYFNPNLNKEIQITGHVVLPDGEEINPKDVSAQIITESGNWISHSNLDVANGNLFTLGLDSDEIGSMSVQVHFNLDGKFYEYFYNGTTWQRVDWSQPNSNHMISVTQSLTNIDINISDIFASQIKINGTVDFESDVTLDLMFMDIQTGNNFGWQDFNNQTSKTFSIILPENAQSGDKYIVKANINTPNKSESYFVDFRDGEIKLVPDTNIQWSDVDGKWLPNSEQTGYFELPEDLNNISDINIDFTNDAIDSQFYIIEGNVTVPSSFTPSSYNTVPTFTGGEMGDRINFEVIDKDSGDSLSYAEMDANLLDTNLEDGSKIYSYKIKLDSPREVILRVHYESGMEFNGYFVGTNGELISDLDVEYERKSNLEWTPVLEENYIIILTNEDKHELINLDFNALDNDTYKIEGEIVLPETFVPKLDWDNRRIIMVEATNANTGEWLGMTDISTNEVENKDNTYAYSLSLRNVDANTSIIVKLIKDEYTLATSSWEAFYILFNDDANLSDVSFIAEENIHWSESGLDIDEKAVRELDEDNKVITINIDYTSVLADYESSRLSISGTITLAEDILLGQTSNYMWNNVRVELIDKNNGDWIGSTYAKCDTNPCSQLTYDIEITDGNYILRVVKEIDGVNETYFVNFGDDRNIGGDGANTDKIINGQNVDLVAAEHYSAYGVNQINWMYDFTKTGWLDTSLTVENEKIVNIDFSNFENDQVIFAGTVTVPYNFEVGTICTNSDGDIKRCSWEEPKNKGYDNPYGFRNLRIEMIDANTSDNIASADLRTKVENTNDYEFKLTLGEKNGVKNLIVKIIKETYIDGQRKFDEIYYNFGDHNYDGIGNTDANEKLINGKKVPMIQSNTINQWGYTNMVPDTSISGYIALSDSLDNFNADISQLGQNDLKIKGNVTFKNDFDISSQNNYANISAIDTATGISISNTPIENDGSYELNLGEDQGEYVLELYYAHNEYNNWQNNWSKTKYYDFGSDKAYGTTGGTTTEDTIKNDSEVRWLPKLDDKLTQYTTDSVCWRAGKFWNYTEDIPACYEQPTIWLPNVKGIIVTDATVEDVDIDLSATVGNTLNIEITNLPLGATNKYVMIVNPYTYADTWQNMDGNSTTITELIDGNYTVGFGYELNGKNQYFFMSGANNSAVSGSEVRWTDLGNGITGPSGEDTTYLNLSEDTNISITMPVVVSNSLTVTVTGLENDKKIDLDFRSSTKPYGTWETTTTSNESATFNITNIKDDDFFLGFKYEENEYIAHKELNGSITLKKDPEWIAKTANGDDACGGTVDWDNCDWDNSVNWRWVPGVTPVTINSAVNPNVELTLPIPPTYKVTGAINLDSEFASKDLNVNIYKYNESESSWKNFILDSNGDVNGSIKVNGGDNYRIVISVDGLGSYVYENGGTWLSQNTSWESSNGTWSPKPSTLININSNLNLGEVVLGAGFSAVTINLENLDTDGESIVEDVWIVLESDVEGSFGQDNVNWDVYPITYNNVITLKVPSGSDYKLLVYSSSHKSGYASNGNNGSDSMTEANKISWDEIDSIDASSDVNFTVTFPSTANGDINGTVSCGTDNCRGWINAENDTSAKGSPVSSDGTFEIKGLDTGDYQVSYMSYVDGLILEENNVTVNENQTTEISLEKASASLINISGTIAIELFHDTSEEVVIIKIENGEWRVWISERINLNDDSFSFVEVPTPSSGVVYGLAYSKRTYNADYSSSISFGQVLGLDGFYIDMPASFNSTLSDTVLINSVVEQ